MFLYTFCIAWLNCIATHKRACALTFSTAVAAAVAALLLPAASVREGASKWTREPLLAFLLAHAGPFVVVVVVACILNSLRIEEGDTERARERMHLKKKLVLQVIIFTIVCVFTAYCACVCLFRLFFLFFFAFFFCFCFCLAFVLFVYYNNDNKSCSCSLMLFVIVSYCKYFSVVFPLVSFCHNSCDH